jgi:signal transduction histidine kinase
MEAGAAGKRGAAPRAAAGRALLREPISVAPATAAAGAAGLAVTVAVLTGLVDVAYRSPPLHAAVETAAALASIVAAQSIYGRFRSSLQLRDLVLTASLGVFAVVNLAFTAVPAVLSGPPGPFRTWAPLLGHLAATALFASAAFLPDRILHRPGEAALRTLGLSAGAVAVIAAIVLALGETLPVAARPTSTPSGPHVVGNPLVLAVQLASTALFAAAAVRFTQRAARAGDGLVRWLAVAAVLGGFARLNYFLFPSLYTPWFYAGDALRLACFLALFAGGVHETRRMQRALAASAVLEERRRIARELHDGVTQDLAYIVQQLRHARGGAAADALVRAAEDALDESRHAISALNRPAGGLLGEAVAIVATEAAEREGRLVDVDVAGDVAVPGRTLQEVLRVVREAVVNAIRHGDAQRIRVVVHDHPRVCVSIADDGSGFDPERAPRAGRVGLEGMAARVAAIGGELTVSSEPGRGTEVRVTLP